MTDNNAFEKNAPLKCLIFPPPPTPISLVTIHDFLKIDYYSLKISIFEDLKKYMKSSFSKNN